MFKCARCGEEKESVDPNNRRCRSCDSVYQSKWRKLAKERARRAAYNSGRSEMKSEIVATFRLIGERDMNGFTAAVIAGEMKA